MTINIVYVMAVYFFFIMLFGESKNRIHSAIIFLSSFLNMLFQHPESYDLQSYVYNRNISILWDGVTALILTMFLVFDKVAWKHALLLAFAVMCHTMIIYDLTKNSSIISNFFYSFYDELIIMIGLLQMAVSYDGLIGALDKLQELLHRISFCSYNTYKSLFKQEKRKGET